MPDYTDLELAEMEKQLNKIYKQAQSEIQEKWDKYMVKAQAKADKAQNDYIKALTNGDPNKANKAKDQYEKTMLNMTLQNEHYQAMINQVTDKLSETNEIALTYLNDQMPKIYCHSYNEFENEKVPGYSFELVNEDAVKHLIKSGNKSLLPQKQLNIPKDKLWNTKNINSQVLQGILQGESINKISKRLQNVTDMNHNSAVRNARTMTTGAENKGRQDSFVRAANDGVKMKRIWVAAHDSHTRDSHLDLHGQEAGVNEPFQSEHGEIMYPGDPEADPREVYNCRCAIRTKILGFDWSKLPKDDYAGTYAGQYQGVGVTAQYYSMLNEDKALGNAFWKALNAEGKPSQVWKDYLAGNTTKEVTKTLDGILAKYKGTGQPIKPGAAKKAASVAVQKAPKPDLGMYQDKSMTATFYSVKAENKELGKEFWAILQAENVPSVAWTQYLSGTASKELTEKLDKILLQHKGTGAWSKPVSAKKLVFKETFKDLDDINDIVDFNIWNEVQKAAAHEGTNINDFWKAYKAGKIKNADLDKIFKEEAVKTTKKAAATDTDILTAYKKILPDHVLDLDDNLFDKVDDILTKKGEGNLYYKKWLNDIIQDEDLDKFFSKIAKKEQAFAAKAASKTDDLYDKMKASLPQISQMNKETLTEVLDTLASKGISGVVAPTNYYKDWLAGKIIDPDLDALFGLTSKTTTAAEKAAAKKASDKIAKAQAKMAAAQGNLDSLGNKTYSGIWKEDVTLADYKSKATKIQAKKEYFLDQIDQIKNDPNWMSWMNYSDTQKAAILKKMEDKIIELEEFEAKGKLYLQYAKEYDKAFEAYKKLQPVSEAFGPDLYTAEHKAMALWARNDAEYRTLDKYYDKVAKKIHDARTAQEYEGYYHYTWGSGPFNQPLAGFKGSWSPSAFVGPNKMDIDYGGYGDKIRGLTSLCEKSKYDKPFWVQTGQNRETLEGFLGIPYGSLGSMTDQELQQFLGVEKELPQFISGAINKGGGTYTPGNMLFNIYCPEGSEALYVRQDGRFGKAEHEMILQRGGTYKITKIYWGTDKVHGGKKLIVDLELHPEKGYNKFQQKK